MAASIARACSIPGCEKKFRARDPLGELGGLCSTHYNGRKRQPGRHPKAMFECAHCGEAVEKHVSNSREHRFCSYPCRSAFRAERARSARLPVLHTGPRLETPRREPAVVAVVPLRVWTSGRCAECGEWFLERAAWDPRYCSPRCQRGAAKKRSRGYRWGASTSVPWGSCPDCGADYVSSQGRARCRSCLQRRRNAKGFSVAPGERNAIYERDGWVCQLCDEPVDGALPRNHDWAPSLDHVLPGSKGGSNHLGNLRLAHRWCNAVRGDETYHTADDLRAA